MARNNSNNNGGGMNDNTKTILTLLTGAVAGAVTALLLAPQSGAETRSAIRRTASRLSGDLGSNLKSGVDKLVNLGRGGDDEFETSDELTDLTGEGLGADGYGSRGRGASMRGTGNPTGLGSTGSPTTRRGQGGLGDV
jgi:gas vesicle protein